MCGCTGLHGVMQACWSLVSRVCGAAWACELWNGRVANRQKSVSVSEACLYVHCWCRSRPYASCMRMAQCAHSGRECNQLFSAWLLCALIEP